MQSTPSSTPSLSSKLPWVGTTIFTVMSKLAAQYNAVNLGQGFPDFPCSDELIDLITKAMKAGYNQYAPMEGLMALREQIAIKTERLYGYAPDPVSEITITSGGTEALYAAIATVIHPGDEAIVLEPCYDSYIPAIELNGGKVIRVPLTPETYGIDWERLTNAFSPRTKLLIINTPHNPTGTMLSGEDRHQLSKLINGTDILLISDEVYEHLVYDGTVHQSVLYDPILRKRAFVVSSFGKTYHATGWKVGYCIASAALTKEFRKVHQYLTFSTFTPVQYALAEYLQQPEHYLRLPQLYQQKRDYFLQLMQQTRFRMLPCQGSYFALAAYGHISGEPDTDYAMWLTREIGVAAIPVSVFYQERTDYKILRFCFAKREETLERAVARLQKV